MKQSAPEAPPPPRYISRLQLTAFRSYESAVFETDCAFIALTGPNGAGKTNLIEAISLVSPGRGLRGVPFDQLQRQGSSMPWAVAATIMTPAGPAAIGTGMVPGRPSRRVRINGANAPSVEEMSAYVRLLWLTPAMDGLFTGPAANRRRFLDRLVMTLIPDHARSVTGFEKAMRQRNRLLEENADPDWIGALEVQMAEFAAALHFARADSLAHLQRLAATGLSEAFPVPTLALEPLFSPPVASGDADLASSSALEAALLDHWAGQRGRDRAAGRTLTGPHRTDLLVTHAQKSMPARLCSTGEQKALLIGLVLAHARLVSNMTGITPILLLDEVAAHLDPGRRRALFAALGELNTQVWMTGTDPHLFEGLEDRAAHVRIRDGQLDPASCLCGTNR